MATIDRFEDLKCWQAARQLCKDVFSMILSKNEIKDFPLKDQINRASASIMDNIAEGFGRDGNKEFRQFLTFAKGSCTETLSQSYRAIDRDYITKEQFDILNNKCTDIQKMITGLIKYINTSEYKGTKFMEDAAPYTIEIK